MRGNRNLARASVRLKNRAGALTDQNIWFRKRLVSPRANRADISVAAVVLGVAAVVAVGLETFSPGILCSTESERIDSAGSKVYFLLGVNRCSAIDGTVKIQSVEKATGKKDLILFAREEANIAGKCVNQHEFEVTLPNLIYLSKQARWSQGVRILYVFTPVENPTERARYRLYVEHPNDPRAIAWAAKHYAVRYAPARSADNHSQP